MVNNIPVNGWPQLKDLEAVQPTLDRLDKIEAWKRTVKEETFTGDDITIENALALQARSLITEINAIQDLHGYDHPWAGGAYKNKFDITEISDVGNTYKIKEYTLNANTTYTISTNLPKNNNNSANLFFYLPSASPDMSVNGVWSGQTRTLTTGADGKFIIGYRTTDYTDPSAGWYLSHEIQIEEGSTATSFAPYSNICPISGRTAVAVDDTGLNMWDATADDTVYGWGGTWSKSGQTYTCVASSSSIQLFSENGTATQASHAVSVEPNSNYCVSVSGMNVSQVFGVMYDKNKQFLRFVRQQTIVNNSAVIAVPSDAYYMGLRIDNNSATSGKTYNFNIQIEEDSTATPYVPYAHSSATISLGQTVYGADINWDTGVMTVKTAVVDMGNNSFSWNYHNSLGLFYGNLPSNAAEVKVGGQNGLSSAFKCVNSSQPQNGEFTMLNYTFGVNKTIWVHDERYTDPTAFKTAVTGQTVTYPLATPTTIQLTPTQLQMLKGYNRVTLSDGYGNIELKALTGANWS